MEHKILATTTQTLAITSQLLAIGIEIGIVAGGFFIYKKLINEPSSNDDSVPLKMNSDCIIVPDGCTVIPAKTEKEATFRERWEKIGRIFRAVLE